MHFAFLMCIFFVFCNNITHLNMASSGIDKRNDRPSRLSANMRAMLASLTTEDDSSVACHGWSCQTAVMPTIETHQSNVMRISQLLNRARTGGTTQFSTVPVDAQGMRVGQVGGTQRAPRNKF